MEADPDLALHSEIEPRLSDVRNPCGDFARIVFHASKNKRPGDSDC